MKVSVFGGSQPLEGSDAYEEARELGRLLAQAGHTVLTGGYIGTMEAVSRGAAEGRAGTLSALLVAKSRVWRRVGANPWVQEEWKNDTLLQRLEGLIQGCDAALALPGGPGTLTEISLMWNLMIIGGIERRPLILIGEGWQAVFDSLSEKLGDYSSAGQRELLKFAPDISSAAAMLSSTAP